MKNDIAAEMQNLLEPGFVQNEISKLNIKMAISNLDKVASIFDNMGLHSGSEAITQIIENISETVKK